MPTTMRLTFGELLACRDAVAEAAQEKLPRRLALELANNIAAALADGVERDVTAIRTAVQARVDAGVLPLSTDDVLRLIFALATAWRRAQPRR